MARDESISLALSAAQVLEAVVAMALPKPLPDDLDTLLQRTVEETRLLLTADRVLLYRFLPDQDAVIAVESVAAEWQALQGELIYDPCFEAGWAERYGQGQLSAITDVQNSTLEPCYIDLLTQLQVQANLVVPVFCGETLWALLIAHQCSSPRPWLAIDIQLMRGMAHQIGQAIYQADLQQQINSLRERLQQQATATQDPTQVSAPQDRPTDALFHLLTNHIDRVLFVRDSVSGQFLYVSPAYERIWQRTCESLYADSTSWQASIHPDDLPQVQASLQSQFQGTSVTREYRIVRPSGEWRWIQAQVCVIFDEHQQPRQMVGWAEDCTARKQLELDLQAAQGALQRRIDQEQLLRSITTRIRSTLEVEQVLATTAAEVRSIFEADRVVIYQLCGNGQRQVVQQALRLPHAAVNSGRLLPEALPPDLMESFRQGQPCIINQVAEVEWPGETAAFLEAFQVKAVMLAPIVLHSSDVEVTTWGVLAIHACDTLRLWQPVEAEMLQHVADQLAIAIHQAELYQQLQTANQELDRLAKTDSLTQLANRRWLDYYLQQEWQRLARQRHPLSVILADVDYFKSYNDTYGHGAGDQALMAIAQAIQNVIKRPADLAARYGGEEFAIVLPNTDTAGAVRVVELVRQHLQDLALPHRAMAEQPTITLSFGVATLVPLPTSRFDLIMQRADHALYAAKHGGRNQYRVFDEVEP